MDCWPRDLAAPLRKLTSSLWGQPTCWSQKQELANSLLHTGEAAVLECGGCIRWEAVPLWVMSSMGKSLGARTKWAPRWGVRKGEMWQHIGMQTTRVASTGYLGVSPAGSVAESSKNQKSLPFSNHYIVLKIFLQLGICHVYSKVRQNTGDLKTASGAKDCKHQRWLAVAIRDSPNASVLLLPWHLIKVSLPWLLIKVFGGEAQISLPLPSSPAPYSSSSKYVFAINYWHCFCW